MNKKPIPTELSNIQRLTGISSAGSRWGDVEDGDSYIEKAAQYQNQTVMEIRQKLLQGKEVEYMRTEWEYTPAMIRDGVICEALYHNIKIDHENRNQQKRNDRGWYTCSQCGQSGYGGEYPFSTIVGGCTCDDCM